MAWNVKTNVSRDCYVAEGDIRRILDIVDKGEVVIDEETGAKNAHAFLWLEGPKGGRFRMSLPDFWFMRVRECICVGDGFDRGGWVNGKFAEPRIHEWCDED